MVTSGEHNRKVSYEIGHAGELGNVGGEAKCVGNVHFVSINQANFVPNATKTVTLHEKFFLILKAGHEQAVYLLLFYTKINTTLILVPCKIIIDVM